MEALARLDGIELPLIPDAIDDGVSDVLDEPGG
jgi:hypothetical protein